MSVETWKAEFYPVPASRVSIKDAITHSLQKWRGTLPEALTKHKVTFQGRIIEGDNRTQLWFNADSCSLCIHFIEDNCSECPIRKYKMAKDIKFDRFDEPCSDEFSEAKINTQPMIDLLSAVLAWNEETSSK